MESMLEITKRVLPRRYQTGNMPDDPSGVKWLREYFEEGCLCVLHGDISVPKEEPDDVAALFYVMWCGCSRHYDASLLYREGEQYESE